MRVLLVEDERTLARAIKRGLEADGMLTDVVHDGDEGLLARSAATTTSSSSTSCFRAATATTCAVR